MVVITFVITNYIKKLCAVDGHMSFKFTSKELTITALFRKNGWLFCQVYKVKKYLFIRLYCDAAEILEAEALCDSVQRSQCIVTQACSKWKTKFFILITFGE